MAEETKAPAAPPATEVVVVEQTKESVVEKEKPTEEVVVGVACETTEKPKEGEGEGEGEEGEAKIEQSESFKEESTIVADLEDPEKKALDDLKQLIQEALNKHEFTIPPPKVEEKKPEEEEDKKVEEVKPVEEEEKKPVCEETHVESTSKEPESSPKEPVKKEEEKVVVAAREAEPSVEKKEEEASVEKTEAEPSVEKTEAEPSVEKKEAETPVEKKSVVQKMVAKVVGAVGSAMNKKVDADGVKTVEAIEETIVKTKESESSSSSSSAPAPPAPVVAESSSCDVVEEKEEEKQEEEEEVPPPTPEEVSIFGVPLLADERSDVILQKFLRARDFKVKEAFTMIKNVVRWRKEFGVEELLDEDLGNDFEKVVLMDGTDKDGHLVCYNVFGEFSNKDLQKNFTAEKFLKWRVQLLEKEIRKLDLTPGGISTFVHVNDLKSSPGLFQKDFRFALYQAINLFQDNYPEFVAKQIFINVPWWFLAVNRMISPFLTQRTKSKFVYAGPSKSADTLFKYIAPEQVPVQFGGLKKEGEQEFSTADEVTEIIIKPASKQTIEFPVPETCTLVWELRVVGWEVSYGAEFIPVAEDGYTVIVSKTRKLIPTDEPVLCSSFKIGEPGKIVVTIDNTTAKKKKLLYRSKTKSSSD